MSSLLLRWAVLFLVLAVVSALVALTGVPVQVFWTARVLFLVCLASFVVTAGASALVLTNSRVRAA